MSDQPTYEKVFEASELGWPPGWYSPRIFYKGELYYYSSKQKDSEGDVFAWIYSTLKTKKLISVLND